MLNVTSQRFQMIRKPFNLRKLPLDQRETLPWGDFGSLSFSSLLSLSNLDGMMLASAKADLFWISWLMKEAQLSNEIEGTVTTFEEVMGENVGIVAPLERRDDIREVLNYHEAMNYGLDEIKNGRPFSISLIKSLHALLLRGARGERKTPDRSSPHRQTRIFFRAGLLCSAGPIVHRGTYRELGAFCSKRRSTSDYSNRCPSRTV